MNIAFFQQHVPVNTNAARTSLKSGWVRAAQLWEQHTGSKPSPDSSPEKDQPQKYKKPAAVRRKSWIPWPARA
ncbi:hypothetical protein [Pontibacter chitinilyticus]|uniref:hypothetical protein n=1 Tax=Pontibacter chitinilyticus TaxID=2674989 RepID=UPI00321AF439